MAREHVCNLPFFVLCATFLTLASGIPSEVNGSRQTEQGQESIKRTPRATLHELLMKNRNIASIAPEDVTVESIAVEDNQNKRNAVLKEGGNSPDYVYGDDDESSKNDFLDDEGRDLNAVEHYDRDLTNDRTNSAVGDQVTAYASQFAASDSPSYADPNLLAAVMNQADEANFRYPSDKLAKFLPSEDQALFESAKIETTLRNNKNEIDPFSLFPPSFHDFLEIPLHTFSNGTTYNFHKRNKTRHTDPIITDGYTNTNINGQESVKMSPLSEIKRLTPPRRTNIAQRPSTADVPEIIPPYVTTINLEKQNTFNTERKRFNYGGLDTNSEIGDFPNRLPPTSDNSLRKRPVRPSLRFRTVAPASTNKPIQVTLRTTTTQPLKTTSTVIEATTYSKKKRIYRPFNRHNRPLSPPFDKNSTAENEDKFSYPSAKNHISVLQEIQSTVKNRTNPIIEISYEEKSKTSFPTNEPMRVNIYNYQDVFDTARPPTKIVKLEDIYNRFENASPNIPSYLTKDEFDNDQSYVSESYPRDFHKTELYHQKDFRKKIKKPVIKTAIFSEFKPSKIDPFHDNYPFTNPIRSSMKKPTISAIIPTTFRPNNFLNDNNRPSNIMPTTFKPTNTLSSVTNTYERQSQEQNFYYGNTYIKNGSPFTNSHAVQKPYIQNTNYNPVELKSDSFLEEESLASAPMYLSSPVHNGAKLIQSQYHKYDEHTPLTSDYQPPRGVFRGRVPSNEELTFRKKLVPRRRTRRPMSKRRPSFLEKLGFFRSKIINRRSGESGPNAETNDISLPFNNKNDKPHIDYVLSNGPPPFHGKRVVVFGPFKEPPIGAPRIFTTNQASAFAVPKKAVQPATGLEPPSSTESPFVDLKSLEREPSFKVINLPTESNIIMHNITKNKPEMSKHAIVGASFDVGKRHQNTNAHAYRPGSVFSVTSPNMPSSSHPGGILSTSSRSGSNLTVRPKHLPIKVDHNNYHLFEEVSEEDKERLIAATFKFPREISVRRSGLERLSIPLPVPMMTSSGKQVSNFHKIQIPHLSIVRKIGKSSMKKKEQHPLSHVSVSQGDELKASTPIPDHHYYRNIMRITPYPKVVNRKIDFQEPQSYQELAEADLKFGGWNAVGERPVVSYVKENTPMIEFKEEKINVPTKEEQRKNKTDFKPSIKKSEKLDSSSLTETDLVRFSSELNVEAPEVIRSYLVDPPRRV